VSRQTQGVDALASALDGFLADHEHVLSWAVPHAAAGSIKPCQVFIGRGEHALEVAVAGSHAGARRRAGPSALA
jgi:hypothetical protein